MSGLPVVVAPRPLTYLNVPRAAGFDHPAPWRTAAWHHLQDMGPNRWLWVLARL